jgi:hypothetical protein
MKKISVENQICGADGCNKPISKKVFFSLGFSANFCAEHAEELIQEAIGSEKQYLYKEINVLAEVGQPAANAAYNIQSNSTESVQRK